jgi:hypothetical protein
MEKMWYKAFSLKLTAYNWQTWRKKKEILDSIDWLFSEMIIIWQEYLLFCNRFC